jgi:molybdate transport system ATP-binding protein
MIEIDATLPRRSFDLRVQCALPRQITGVVGPSGSGKTSLLRALAGLEPDATGRIVVDNRVLMDSASRVHVPPHQRRVAYVFQDARLFPHLTALGNLRHAERQMPKHKRGDALDALIESLGLRPLLNARPERLSGGEARRVAVARALLSNPALLLLDEPFNGLDPQTRAATIQLIDKTLRHAGIPVVLVSHRQEEVITLCDECLILRNGEVEARGLPAELLEPRAGAGRMRNRMERGTPSPQTAGTLRTRGCEYSRASSL